MKPHPYDWAVRTDCEEKIALKDGCRPQGQAFQISLHTLLPMHEGTNILVTCKTQSVKFGSLSKSQCVKKEKFQWNTNEKKSQFQIKLKKKKQKQETDFLQKYFVFPLLPWHPRISPSTVNFQHLFFHNQVWLEFNKTWSPFPSFLRSENTTTHTVLAVSCDTATETWPPKQGAMDVCRWQILNSVHPDLRPVTWSMFYSCMFSYTNSEKKALQLFQLNLIFHRAPNVSLSCKFIFKTQNGWWKTLCTSHFEIMR